MAQKKSSAKKPSTKAASAGKANASPQAKSASKPSEASKQASVAAKTSNVSQTLAPDFAKLRPWNSALAVVYFLEAIAILLLSSGASRPVTAGYLAKDSLASGATHHTVLVGACQQLFGINLSYVVAAFLLVAALASVLAASGRMRQYYERGLTSASNALGWISWSVIAPLMLLVISLLAGIHDLALLVLLVFLAHSASVLMLRSERLRGISKLASRRTLLLASLVALAPWVAIAIYLLASVVFGAGVAGAMIGIVVSTFVLLGLMAAASVRYFQGKTSYLRAEATRLALGFIVVSALTWQIYIAFLQP